MFKHYFDKYGMGEIFESGNSDSLCNIIKKFHKIDWEKHKSNISKIIQDFSEEKQTNNLKQILDR